MPAGGEPPISRAGAQWRLPSGLRKALGASLLGLTAAVSAPVSAPVSAQEIIGHAGLRLSELSRNQARLFFTMRLTQLPDNTPMRVFVLPDDHPLHARFAKTLLGLFPYQLRQVWDRQVYSGTGQAPTTVASEQDMIARVAATPGAIGYVERAPTHPGIRPLPVR